VKLNPQEAARYLANPRADSTGLLIYGADAMRVALKRQQLVAALLGPNAEQDMRLTRLAVADLRKEPAQIVDAIKAIGFFAGPRAVLIEDANESVAVAIGNACADWSLGDAQIVITAGALKPASSLRKLFEKHANAYAVGVYNDALSRAEVQAEMNRAGLAAVGAEGVEALVALAGALGPGEFRHLLEKLVLYSWPDAGALTLEDIAACAPHSTEAGLDDMLHRVAEGNTAATIRLLRRLQAQGSTPTGLCIGALRHFKTLYAIASDTRGPEAGAMRARPPLFGPRRAQMLRQAKAWGCARLQRALAELTATDLQLRSPDQKAPAMALAERSLLRLAAYAPGGRRYGS